MLKVAIEGQGVRLAVFQREALCFDSPSGTSWRMSVESGRGPHKDIVSTASFLGQTNDQELQLPFHVPLSYPFDSPLVGDVPKTLYNPYLNSILPRRKAFNAKMELQSVWATAKASKKTRMLLRVHYE